MAQHKWHKEIKCFIEGGEVERKNINGDEWYLITDIGEFSIDYMDYRIKPQPKEPQYLYIYGKGMGIELTLGQLEDRTLIGKIKLEVDDDTNPA